MSKKYDVLTYKIPIIIPLSTDWKTFEKIAGDLIYNAIKIMNDSITMHNQYIREKYLYEVETGKKFDEKKFYGDSFLNIRRRRLRRIYASKGLSTTVIDGLGDAAVNTFKTIGREVLANNALLPNFRRDQPIPVRAQSLGLTENYTVFLPFMSKELADKYGFKGRRKQSFEVQLSTKGDAKVVLDRILDGTYTMCDSKVQRTLDGKWFLLLTYKQPRTERKLDGNKIMGIDLGIVSAAAIAISGERKVFEIKGGEITNFRRRIEGRRKSIQNQLPVCSNNRRGHGRKTLLKPLETLSHKVENFKDTTNHRYSKYIVDLAEKYGVGTIQMEDLTGISKRDSFLATWSYYDLQDKIEYKARMRGIDVIKVKPRYTSQRCYKCGVIDKESRKGQTFKCTACGHKRNADYNAAENLTIKGIDKIIEEQMEFQRKASA